MRPQKAILVTGGAGYIGSHTCKALHTAGYLPITVDNLSHGYRECVRWGPLEKIDICNLAGLIDVIKLYRPVAVLHFAGLISVAESTRVPEAYHRTNVIGTKTLLDAMHQTGMKHIVFSSSCAVHGSPAWIPVREDDACAPLNPYGLSKMEAEHTIQKFALTRELNSVILRYFNAAGADPERQTGERHHPETHVIPLAISAAVNGRPFHIYGTDYPTEDGTAIRDYIHVCDLADAHVLALKYLFGKSGANIFNLGSGKGVSVREIAQVVEKVTGQRMIIKSSARRQGDSPILVADPGRAKKILNFVPKRSSITSIVSSAYAWHMHCLKK